VLLEALSDLHPVMASAVSAAAVRLLQVEMMELVQVAPVECVPTPSELAARPDHLRSLG
jgi:hypothetical protein